MPNPCDAAEEKAEKAFDVALAAQRIAETTATRHTAHENECARRYEDWRRASDNTGNEIRGLVGSVSKFTSDIQLSVAASIAAANKETAEKLNGMYILMLSASGGLLLCFLTAILAYVLIPHKG